MLFCLEKIFEVNLKMPCRNFFKLVTLPTNAFKLLILLNIFKLVTPDDQQVIWHGCIDLHDGFANDWWFSSKTGLLGHIQRQHCGA